jgi:hypothetical protein
MRLIGLEGVESIAGLDADDGDRMSGERRYGNEDETDEVCRELLWERRKKETQEGREEAIGIMTLMIHESWVMRGYL